LLVSYDEADRGGQPYHADHYLSLLFRREGDGWFLVHDQNTGTELESGKAAPAETTSAKEQAP